MTTRKLRKAPRHTKNLDREGLEQLVSDLRAEIKRLQSIHNKREKRARLVVVKRAPPIDGRPLRAARERARLHQNDLRLALGLSSRSLISAWEAGRVRMPRKHAERLVEIFKEVEAEPPVFDLT